MTNVKRRLIAVSLVVLTLPAPLLAESSASIGEALFYGTPSVELRLGFEYSSTNDTNSPARGLNLRTRVGYRTDDYLDTNIFVQFQSLVNLVEDFRFDPLGKSGGDLRRDVIGDPDGERVHQAYLEYNGLGSVKLRLGRQEIVLNDARLVGNVNFRQNGQSFDALSLAFQPFPEFLLFGAVINQANTVALTHVDLEHFILLNAEYTLEETHSFTLYTYLLDDENDTRDSATYGMRLDGLCGDFVEYDVTYAWQGDYQSGDDHAGELVNAFLGFRFDWGNFGLGYSRISGQEGPDRRIEDKPFDTLFSTAHKFNGWADQFISTNGANLKGGLEDVYFQIGTELMHTQFLLRLHLFDTTESEPGIHDSQYGEELDFDISRDLTDQLTAQIRLALYNATNENGGLNPTTDEEVFWARVSYKF